MTRIAACDTSATTIKQLHPSAGSTKVSQQESAQLLYDSTHKHPKVKAWLPRHRRFHLHFTPTSASWLNMVERFFRDLTQQAIVSGSFQSVRDLVEAIDTYLAHHNLRAKRYVWRANGTEVLRKINRAWEAAMVGL